jgi:hypothetical protein
VKIARNRIDARWLPARHNLALFRLYAYLRMRGAKPEPRDGVMLPIDRYQSSFENHCVAIVMFAISWVHLAALLARRMPLGVAIVVAPILVPLMLQLPLWLIGGLATLAGGGNNKRLVSASIVAMLVAWSVYHAVSATWQRWPSRIFLALVVANLAAVPFAWLLRDRFAAMEESCAG